MEELSENIVTLVDDEGNEVDFDLLMAFDYEKKRYIALLPMEKIEDVGEDEVVLLEVVKENGEETYVPIENPVLLNEVFETFIDLFEEQLDAEEAADEED